MAAIRSGDTKPELLLRRGLFAHGLRYRLHYAVGTTKVDVAFPSDKKAVNVNGCFWHQHGNCIEASKPKTNSAFWSEKLQKNVERDRRNLRKIRRLGWKVMTVWECELEKHRDKTLAKVVKFIAGP